jgi:hypothetical protein
MTSLRHESLGIKQFEEDCISQISTIILISAVAWSTVGLQSKVHWHICFPPLLPWDQNKEINIYKVKDDPEVVISIHILITYFHNINFNIILPTLLWSSNQLYLRSFFIGSFQLFYHTILIAEVTTYFNTASWHSFELEKNHEMHYLQ